MGLRAGDQHCLVAAGQDRGLDRVGGCGAEVADHQLVEAGEQVEQRGGLAGLQGGLAGGAGAEEVGAAGQGRDVGPQVGGAGDLLQLEDEGGGGPFGGE